MSLDECIHGLGPASACVECNGRAEAERKENAWRTFPAKYDGQCWVCDLPIRAGETIAWRPDQRPIHEACR